MKRPCHWLGTYDNRTQRRTGNSMIRGAHDYQRIPLDFGGGVSVVSDQGLFILPKDGSLELIKANGNMSNNIVLGVAVSKGDGDGKNFIVTSVWDWHGARFSTGFYTRGCHWFPRRLASSEQACAQWHSSRVATFLPVGTVICV